jgi:F-type H+-transporting ATPase subunit b
MPTASSNFLIPNGTFIVELVAFIVVLGIVGRYVLPLINKALLERAERIRTELEAASRAKADAAAEETARREALEEARLQAREIVAQASRIAEQVQNEARARGQAEHDRLVASAESEVRLARQRAVEEAAARIGELVLDVAERVIGREVDANVHRDLIDEAVAALSSDEASGATAAAAGRTGQAT